MQSLNPEIRDIFEALCESEALEQYGDNESNGVKYNNQSNEMKFFDIEKVILSKTNKNSSKTQIDISENDEKDTSTEIILNPKTKDNIKTKIIFL